MASLALSGLIVAGVHAPVRAQQTTVVYALVAANATDAFNDLAAIFERRHPGVTVKPSYAGTQILQMQLEQGAPDDVFLSADLDHITKLKDENLIETFSPVSRTHEVIVVPKANPAGVRSLRDLGDRQMKLVVGVAGVPIGTYTRRILSQAAAVYGSEFETRALANVVSTETNVKQVLLKTSLGEADAGVVYATDVTSEFAAKLTVIPIPSRFEIPAENYIAAVKGAKSPELARDFVSLALSKDGQAVFRRHGYDVTDSRSEPMVK